MLGRFRLDIRKDFFTEMLSSTGTVCPGKWLNYHPWGYLKDVDVVLGDMALVVNTAVLG